MGIPIVKSRRRPTFMVIGANGYIGRHVSSALAKKGFEFRPVDVQPASLDGYSQYVSANLLKEGSLDAVLPDCDHILNFAGRTGTFDGFAHFRQFIDLNETSLLRLLAAVRKRNPGAKVVFPSSRLVYRGRRGHALREDDEKEFKTVYAVNKYAGEQYLKIYHDVFGIDYAVFRICVPYGSLMDDAMSFGTLSHMVLNAQKGQDITVFGDGGQKRSLIHIEDLSEILIRAAPDPSTDNDIFNVGGPDVLSIRQIAEGIAGLYGVQVKCVDWPADQLAIESGDTIFDSSKLMDRMPYAYRRDFLSWVRSIKKK